MESYEQLLGMLEASRQRIADLEILETLHLEALEELSLHQEELRTQNDELRHTQESLTEISRRYRDLFDYAPVAHFLLDKTGAITECNLAGCDLLQATRISVLRRPMQLYVAKSFRDAFNAHLATAVSDKVSTLELQIEGRKNRSTSVQISVVAETIDGSLHYRMAAVDISDRKKAEEQRQLAATVFEDSSEGVMITDAIGQIQRVNPAFTIVTGYSEAEVLGKKPTILASGRHDKGFYAAMWEQLSREGHWQGEIWNRRKNGEIYPEWLKINTVYDEDKKVRNRVGIFKDISEKMHQGGNTSRDHFAFYDMLTQLPNRTLFLERLKHALISGQRDRKQIALLYLDLDRFKQVNDTLGHQTGDMLLQDVAVRLRQQVRANDTVARLGGDEFTVIISELGGMETAQDIAHRVASNICKHLALPFQIGAHEIVVGSSVGVAYYPEHGHTYSELVKHADLAMYRAKSDGGGRYVTFTQDMSKQLQHRVLLESALRDALRRNELKLVYQPIMNAVNSTMVGVEVLLRWHGYDRTVSPLEFVPILEELGLGSELARWVLANACRELMAMPFWHDQSFWFSINISPQVLNRNHIGWIQDILEECGMSYERLIVEVTEDHLRYNPELAINTLTAIRGLGVRIAMDDFGSGYSSLSRLRDFPIDLIKIDRSFVSGLPHRQTDLAIIVTIITLARELGLELLAEGVETEQQLQQLVEKGCSTIQGFVYAHPMPAAAYVRWVSELNHQSALID
ncbi:MAG: EAL domain-containing protein [Methylomonas sp.]